MEHRYIAKSDRAFPRRGGILSQAKRADDYTGLSAPYPNSNNKHQKTDTTMSGLHRCSELRLLVASQIVDDQQWHVADQS